MSTPSTSEVSQNQASNVGQNEITEEIKSASSHEQDENNSDESETTEQDESLESTDDENESKDDSNSNSKKKTNGFQKRVNKLTARASLAEQERDYWREQVLKQQGNKNQVEQQAPEKKPDGRPRAEDFDSYPDYEDALVEWKIDQREAKRKADEQKSKAESERRKQAEEYQSKLNAFMEKHDDFEDVIQACEVTLTDELMKKIGQSDLAPEVMYNLAKNPKEIERLNTLSGDKLTKALGIFEDKLANSQSQEIEKVKTSKAPAPINPVGSKSAGMIAKSSSEPGISFPEYERRRIAEMKANQK